MAAYLIDVDSSEQYKITEPTCKVGSATGNDILLSSPHVSPQHVRIDLRGSDYCACLAPGGALTRKFLFVFDINNCTHNGMPLNAKGAKLKDGDKLQIGSRLLQFRLI